MKRFAAYAMFATFVAAGCSSKKPEERKEAVTPAAEPAPAEPVKPAEAPAAAPAPPQAADPTPGTLPPGFPPECVAYAALIDKLKTCDKIGGAREGLTRAYDSLRTAWIDVPADRAASVAAQCKTQADSLRNAAAATCGW